MYRFQTRRKNYAIRSATCASVNSKSSSASSTPPLSPTESSELEKSLEKNIIISNIHPLITNEKLMKSKKNKKKVCSLKFDTPDSAITPPSTPSSPTGEDSKLDYLRYGWEKFSTTESGEPDQSIVVYQPNNSLCGNFEPFDIDRFLAEKLLKELDIDPKFALF